MVKIISIASWEPRFYIGLNDFLNKTEHESAIIFYYDDYKSKSDDARNDLRNKFSSTYQEHMLNFMDSMNSWKTLRKVIIEQCSSHDEIFFDITTSPRDSIFSILYMLKSINCKVKFIYHRPEGYGDWVSKDSEKPELIFKMSGIFSLRKPTLLFFLPGYDSERMQQLIARHEPKKIIIGLQKGAQYDSIKRCRESSVATIERLNLSADYFDYDAYSDDYGLSAIENAIKPHLLEYNILAGTLGPKPSSIALFHLFQKNPQIGIIYVRSRDYNTEYSHGYSSRLEGEVIFSDLQVHCEIPSSDTKYCTSGEHPNVVCNNSDVI